MASSRTFKAAFIYKPPPGTPEILYEDAHILVVNKPPGLLTVPGRGPALADSLETRVQALYPSARIVHRLDEATSGLLVMALTPEALRRISMQFERRKTQKTYIARVFGTVQKEQGHVDLPLICDWPNRPLQKVDHERGKSAQTDWNVLAYEKNATRLALYPITGRSHQLRVHMMEIDHPILGDVFYAHDAARQASERLQLHAHKLTIHHPEDGRFVHFESPCPF